MFRRVALVRTDVSEEYMASIMRVKRIDELGTTLEIDSSDTSVLTRAARRHTPEGRECQFPCLRRVVFIISC
jgi:hypothetical protein